MRWHAPGIPLRVTYTVGMNNPQPLTVNGPVHNDPGETGQVIVRLHPTISSNTADLRQLASEEGLADLKAFLDANPQYAHERVVNHVPPESIRDREAIAARSPYPPLKSMSSYWRLDVSSADDVEPVRQQLHDMDGIELAHHETAVSEAACPSVAANTYEAQQHVLDAAPVGINARSAWCRSRGQGQRVKAVDVELAWITNHEDLPKFEVLIGDNAFDNGTADGNHGTAALGIVAAINNDHGVIGIAPQLASLNVASHYDAKSNSNYHVANAIDAATTHLAPGDIIFIEVQRWQDGKAFPVEINSADFHAIRHATAQGIIVVEAAGNWVNNDLDKWVDPTGDHSLNTADSKFADSGAILVGASSAAVVSDPLGYEGHKRYYRSNFGSRVNCYAIGEQIYSAGYGNLAGGTVATQSYTGNFGETSGATAVIAGAAAVVQSWYKAWCGQPLSPAQMRAILSNPATATRQANVDGEPIGVMPDLKRIMTCKRRFMQVLSCLLRRILTQPQHDPREFEAFKHAAQERERQN